MPDLITVANDLKTYPDQWLAKEVQQPTGAAPAYLVLAELQRRKLLRAGGDGAKPPTSSVMQDTLRGTLQQLMPPQPTGPPPPAGAAPPAKAMPGGAPGSPMPGAMPPGNMGMPPRAMAEGGGYREPLHDPDDPDDTDADIPGLLDAASARYGMDPRLGRAVARTESGFRAGAISPKGAIGPMQLMPGTARDLGVNPRDPRQNIDGGMRHLRDLIDKYGGDTEKALAAYNAGEGAVQRFGGVPPYPETQAYVKKILGQLSSQRALAPSSSFARPTAGQQASQQALLRTTPEDMPLTPVGPNGMPQQAIPGMPDLGPQRPLPYTGPPAPAAAEEEAQAAPPAQPPGARSGLGAYVSPEVQAAEDYAAKLRAGLAPTTDEIARSKAAIKTLMGERPDFSHLQDAITQLQRQAEENLHPSISQILMHMGFALMASHAPNFGMQLGEAGMSTMQAMEKQRQTARANYVEALKAGATLQDRMNAYDEKVATLGAQEIGANQRAKQTELAAAERAVVTARANFQKTLTSDREARARAIAQREGIELQPGRPIYEQLAQYPELQVEAQTDPATWEQKQLRIQEQKRLKAAQLTDEEVDGLAKQVVSHDLVPAQFQEILGRDMDTRRRILRAAQKADPSFSWARADQEYKTMQATENSFAQGAKSQMTGPLSTSLEHVALLDTARRALANGQLPVLNKIAVSLGLQTGSDLASTFDMIGKKVSEEVSKAYIPSGGGQVERMAAAADFDHKMSDQQLRSNIVNTLHLLDSQRITLQHQYDEGTYHRGKLQLFTPEATDARRTVLYGPLPDGGGKRLDQNTLRQFINAAEGDPNEARRLASQHGWIF